MKFLFNNNIRFRYVFLITNVFLLAFVLLSHPTYQTNDDVIMLLFSSGAYTGEPSPYLVYINIIMGWFISILYRITDSIEWYSWVQFVCNLVAFNAIAYTIHRRCNNDLTRICLTFFILCTQAYFLTCMEFTFLAFWLGFASVCLLSVFDSKTSAIFSYILFFLGSLYRIEAVLIPYAIAFPLYILPVKLKEKKYYNKIIFSIILLITCYALKKIDRYAYQQDPAWKYYISYNEQRGKINDNPSRDIDISDLRLGKNKEQEYQLLKDFQLSDGNILKDKDLKLINELIQSKRTNCFHQNIKPYYWSYRASGAVLVGLLFLILFILSINNKAYLNIISMFLSSFILCCLTAYLMTFSPPKERVILSLNLSLLIVVITLLIRISFTKRRTAIIISLLFILYGSEFLNKTISHQIAVEKYEERYREIEKLANKSSYPKILYTCLWYTNNSFHISKSLTGKTTVKTSWTLNSPHTHKWYKGYNSLFEDGLPLLVEKKGNNNLDKILKLIDSEYNIKARIYIEYESTNYQIVKLEY